MQGTTFVSMKIDGNPLDDKTLGCLDSLVVENAVNLPDSFTASFADPEGEVLRSISGGLGKKVQIAVTHAEEPGPVTILDGELTAVEVDYDAAHSGDGTRTVVRGMDQSHRLQQGRKTKTWNQKTASEVAVEVARSAGLDIGDVDDTSITYEHVVQGNIGDLEFMKKLAVENDREAVVSDGKFNFRKQVRAAGAPEAGTVTGSDPLQLVLKGNLLSLHATIRTNGQVKEVEVRGWDSEAKNVVKSTASASTSAATAGTSPATLAAATGNATHVSVTTPFSQSSETDSAAQALADHLASAFAELEGSVDGHPRLCAGSTVSLSNVGAPIDGKYVVTSTCHRLDRRGYETGFVVSGQHDRSLLGLVAGGAAGAHDGRFPGVVPAIVGDVDDPNKQGRVKVRFPWLDDSYVSDWARMVQFGAGKDRGAVFLPEVDDEVLVAFEFGDPRRPYVVGSLYNGVDKPNEGDGLIDSSGVKRRGVVSKQGSMMIFFDDPGKDGVALLSSDKGLKVALNKTKTTIHIASTGEVTIEGTTKVTIDGGQQLVLKGQQIQMGDEQTRSIEVKGSQVSLSSPSIQLGSA
jgi:phage protein D